MQEVDALCSRALIIRNGQLAVDAQLEDLRESNHLQLTTSFTKDQLILLLQPLNAITDIEEVPIEDASHHYRLSVKEMSDHHALCGEIANLIITGGGTLYSINQENRDLETLFREVNETPLDTETNKEEEKDAA